MLRRIKLNLDEIWHDYSFKYRLTKSHDAQGRSDGVDIGIYTPKISPSKLFVG